MTANMLNLQPRKILIDFKSRKSPLMIEGSFVCLVQIRIRFITIDLDLTRAN